MSVFTSMVSDVLAIPHDPPHTVTIRKLAPKHLEAARKASQRQSLEDLRHLGDPAFMKQIQELMAPDKDDAVPEVPDGMKASTPKDPLLLYDRVSLIEAGVTGWTYPQDRSREVFEDLDDDTQEFLARAILRLAKPSLFQVAAEMEADRKNV